MKTDYKKVNEFLKNNNLSIDHIFSELDDLYKDIDEENGKILSEENNNEESEEERKKKEKERKYIQQNLKSNLYKQASEAKDIYKQTLKEPIKTKYSEKELESERLRQLEINKRLEQEFNRTINTIKNKDECVQAFNNQRNYMMQNKASIAVIPRNNREIVIPSNSNASSFSPMRAMGWLWGKFQQILAINYPLQMAFGISIISIVMWPINFILTAIGSTIGSIGSTFGIGKIPWIGDIFSHEKNAIAPIGSHEFIYKDESLKNTIKEYDTQIKEAGTRNDHVKKYALMGTRNSLIQGGLGEGKISLAPNETLLYISKGIGYIAVGVVLYYIIKWAYNKYKSIVEKNKKTEYAKANKIAMQEISIPILCKYSKKDKKYFEEIEIIDESLGSTITNKILSSKTLLNMNNKTLVGMKGMYKTISYGMETKTLSPLAGKCGNMLLGFMNNYTPICRGCILRGVK